MTSSSSENNRLQLIEEMLRDDPEDSFLNYAAALEYQKIGNSTKAIEMLTCLLQRDPDYLGAYYQLGKLHESEANNPGAIEIYRAGIEVAHRQKNSKAQSELSEALMLLQDDDDL